MSSATAPVRTRMRGTAARLVLVVLAAVVAWQGRVHASAWRGRKAGREALQRDDPAEARRHFERCLKAWPHNGEANFLAAQPARRTGDLAEADEPTRPVSPAQGDDEERRRSRQSDVRLMSTHDCVAGGSLNQRLLRNEFIRLNSSTRSSRPAPGFLAARSPVGVLRPIGPCADGIVPVGDEDFVSPLPSRPHVGRVGRAPHCSRSH
jgi:hypothetical protein